MLDDRIIEYLPRGSRSSYSSTRLPFNGEVANMIKSLPYVKDVVPGYTAQVQLNVEGNIENANVFATDATVAWQVAPTLTLVPGSSVQDNNPSAMLVGYNIANPPGYTHNPLIRVGQAALLHNSLIPLYFIYPSTSS